MNYFYRDELSSPSSSLSHTLSDSLCFHSAETVEYTDCISSEEEDSPPTSVLDMTQNNLMVRPHLEVCWMWSTPSLPSLPGPLWSRLVAFDIDPLRQTEQFDIQTVFMLNWIFLLLLTVWTKTVYLWKTEKLETVDIELILHLTVWEQKKKQYLS